VHRDGSSTNRQSDWQPIRGRVPGAGVIIDVLRKADQGKAMTRSTG
jgi:hypothetical protein